MKVRKYLAPPMDGIFIGPHMSECMINAYFCGADVSVHGKWPSCLVALDTFFACERTLVVGHHFHIHTIHHVLNYFHPMGVEMP